MPYVQLVQPDLTITETAGLCLSFSRRVFGAPVVEPTAWEGWSRAKYKHEDRNWPRGVSVPVWFDWWGQLPGDRQKYQYGHVAVLHSDGKVYSSPLGGHGRAWFASVDDLVRAFGGSMRYVGWSEDISNVRVVKEEDNMVSESMCRWIIEQTTGRAPVGRELADRVGKYTAEYVRDEYINSADAKEFRKKQAEAWAALDKVAKLSDGQAEKKLEALSKALRDIIEAK